MKNRHRLLSRSRQRRQFLGADRPSRRTPFGRSLRFERLETRALLTVVVGMDDATGFFTIRDTDGPDSDVAIDGAEDFNLENNDVTLSFALIDVPDLNPLPEPGLLVTDPAGVVAGNGAFQINPGQAFIPNTVTTVGTLPVLTPVIQIDLQAGDDNIHFASNFAGVPTVTTVNVHGGDNGSNDLLILDGSQGVAEHVSMALPFNATEVTAIAGYGGVTINARGAEIIEYRAAGGDDELLLRPFFGTAMRIDSASNAITDRAVSDGLPEVQWSKLDRFTIQPGAIGNAYEVIFDLPELIAANFYQVDVLSAGPATPDPVTVTVVGNGGANGFVVKDPGVGEFQVSTPENGGRPVTAINEDVALLRLETGGSDDDVVIDTGNGLLSVPVVYDGGEGSDRLSIVGTPPTAVDEVFYLPGPATTEGRLRYENAASAALMTVDFANLEPVVDLVPAATLTVAGTGADNAISYGPGATPASGVVRVDEFETIEFANKTNLVLAAGPGADTITLNNPGTPAGLTGIAVIGGDPSTSDAVVIHGTTGADTIVVTPTADGGTVQVNALPPVTLSSLEQLVIDGAGGNDSLTVVGTAGDDTFLASPGSASDAGSVGISGLLSVGFQNLGGVGSLTVNGGGGADTLVVEGTSADDTLSVAAGGTITVNGRIALNQTAVENLELRGLARDDTFNLVANHGYGGINIEGGSAAGDSVFLTSAAAETVTIRPSSSDASRQLVTGLGGTINVGGAEQIVYLGVGGDDTLVVAPGPVGSSRVQNSPTDQRGRITSDTLPIIEWNALGTFRLSHGGITSARVDTFVLEDLFDATNFEYQGVNDSLVIEGGASDSDWTIARSGANVVIASATGLGVGELTVLSGLPDEIRFEALAGNDTLTVDNSGGLITVPVIFHGGAGNDRLELVGSTAMDASEYTRGATSDAGVVVHTQGTTTQTISFTGLEPVLDLVPAAVLIVNGTGGDNAINYTQGSLAANGLVSVDGFETIEFSNKSTLAINALAGSDTINLNNPGTPTGLTGITVNGGDPTTSDILIVNAIPGVNDELDFNPTGVGTGTVTSDATAPDVNFAGIEQLTMVVQDADGDEAEVNGTIGDDTFEFLSGLTPDTFVLVGTMDQNNATGVGPFALVPTTVKGGDVTDDVDINAGAAGGTDRFIFNATGGDDVIASGVDVGDILITNTINGQLVASVDVFNIDAAVIRGLGGNDSFTHSSAIAIPVTYEGGGPSTGDLLTVTANSATIDFATNQITIPGAGAVSLAGVERLRLDGTVGAGDGFQVLNYGLPTDVKLLELVEANQAAVRTGDAPNIAADTLRFYPYTNRSARIERAEGGPVIDILQFNPDAAVNVGAATQGADDRLEVFGGHDSDRFRVFRTQPAPGDAVRVETTLAIGTGDETAGVPIIFQTSVESLALLGRSGSDTFVIDEVNGLLGGLSNPPGPSSTILRSGIIVDGGDGSDRLEFAGTAAVTATHSPGPNPGEGFVTHAIAADSQLVHFYNLEPVFDPVPGALIVNANHADNAINYTQGSIADNGLVSIDAQETIEFTNKSTLTINAGAGSDTINLNNASTPTGLASITVNGGDPTGSDAVIVNGTAGADAVNVTPTAADAATIQLGALGLTVQSAERLTYNGLGGNDNLTIVTPNSAAVDIIRLTPGSAADAGHVEIQSTSLASELLPLDFQNLGANGGQVTFVDGAGGNRRDALIYRGTPGDDAFSAFAGFGGEGELHLFNGIFHVPVFTAGVNELTFDGLAGSDSFDVDAGVDGPLPFGSIALVGGDPAAGSSDRASLTGTGVAVSVSRLGDPIIQVFGAGITAGPIEIRGMEAVDLFNDDGPVTIDGMDVPDVYDVTPISTRELIIRSGTDAPVLAVFTDGSITLNEGTAGDSDTLRVHGTAAGEVIIVDTTLVQIGTLKTIHFNPAFVEAIDVFGEQGDDAFTVTPGSRPIFVDGGDPIGTVPGDSLTVNGAIGLVHAGPENDEGGFLTTGETVSFDHIEELIVNPDADCPFLIVGTSGDDDITIIARDGSTHAGADGLRDFTFSINQGPEVLVLNAPDLFIDAGSGDDDIVIRAPAGDISLWGVNIRVAGGPPSIGETNEADRLVLETPGHDNLVFTPTGPDTGTLLVDELINGTFDAGIDTLITLGSFVYVCPDIDFTYTSSSGGVELVEYDGELPVGGALPTDEITIAGTGANDVTTLDPTLIGTGDFASGFSPLFHFRSYGQVTANSGGGGFDRVVVNGTEGADSISSGAANITGLNAVVVIGAGIDQLELNALGGNDTVDLNLTLAGLRKVVNAGAGNDIVDTSGTSDATIFGGMGNDLLTGSTTRDHIEGDAGDDVLFGFGAADTLHGGEGNDMIVGGGGDDFAYGGAGSDTFVWNPGDADDLFEGDEGDDTLAFAGANGTDTYVVSSSGGRVIFQRQPGNVGVNMGGVENIVANSETVQLSGRNEVPANTSPASGFANFTYNEAAGTFDIRMFVTGLTSAIVDSHIHMNVPGSNGPVVVPLGAGFAPVAGGFELTAVGLSLASIVPPAGFTAQDVLMEILLGRAYFNIHTINFPGGEVRGNIIAPSGPTAGSGGGDSLEVRDTTGTALRNIVFDAGNEAEVRNGAALVDTVVVQGLDTPDVITASVPNILDNSYVVAGLPYRIVVNGSDGSVASGALRDQFTLNGNGGDDLLKAQPPLENITRVTLDGGVGDDFLSADAILIGGPGDDFLEGGAGDDQLFGNEGEDTMVGGGGSDTFDGGADFDTVLVSGTSGNDIITANQTAPTTLVTTLNGVIDTDTLVTVAGVRTVERVRIEAGSGDDTIFVMHVDSLGLSAVVDSVLFDVDGGSAQTRDRLSVQDNGIGDLVLYRKGESDNAGSISIGPGNAESLENVFENVEFIQPSAGAGGQLLVFKHDPHENNDERINATHLGAGEAINVDPNIDPGPFDAPDPFTDLPGDQDWYRIVADRTGTLDVQIYFTMIASVLSGRPGLPDGGNLDIELYDADGTLIVDGLSAFGLNDADDNERFRIPAVAGQVYFLRVFGAGVAINNYSITTVNAAAPVPFDLELDDSPVNGTTNPPGQSDNSDTGRSQNDNITYDATPTIFLRLPDVLLAGIAASLDDVPANGGAPGSPLDETILIPHVTSTLTDAPSAGFRVAIFVTENNTSAPVLAGYAQPVAGRPGVFTYTFTTPLAPDGSYFINARVEMIDPAAPQQAQGFGDFGQSLEIFVDTVAPPVSFGLPGVVGDGLFPDSDSGVAGCDETFDDNITTDTIPALWGTAEADAVIRVFLDTNANGIFDATDLQVGFDVAEPFDGTNQYPNGHWELQTTVNLNDDDLFPVIDGLRRFFVTAEDVAGNLNPGDPNDVQVLDIFLDTQGPQVTDVDINNAGNPYDLFDPKPSVDGPTPLVQQLVISIQDLPERVAGFLYDALCVEVAENPGHYQVRGDFNGIIPIHEVIVELDPEVAGQPATGTITLVFWDFGGDGVPFTLDDIGGPLPDDRYTLTILDSLVDPAGNNLDGESNASEPQPNDLVDIGGVDGIPSGDGVPGGNFIARFTIDSVAEVGTWGAGSAWIDTNGNTSFDPTNEDFTNRDITYILGLTSDDLFAGNFALNPGDTADGFDKLAAYGRINGVWRWLVDTDNDGVPNVSQPDARAINGLPVAGNFDGDATNGDEVGLFTGTTWWLDTDHDFQVDTSIVAAAGFVGLPVVGDFDNDGADDLAAWADDRFKFDLSGDGIDGGIDAQFRFGLISPNERPVAADVNGDGIDDIGLFVPNRAGAAPDEGAEWYVLVTGEVKNNTEDVPPGAVIAPASLGPTIIDRIVTDPVDGQPIVRFTPKPFGRDIYVTYGDEFSLPVLGNFDPPVSSSASIPNPGNNTRDPLDVNNDGKISPIDALLVINHLNRFGPTVLTSGGFQRAPFLDVNNNNQVSATDALAVINHLNASLAASSSSAEGEADEFFSSLGESSQSSGDDDVLAALANDQENQRLKRV